MLCIEGPKSAHWLLRWQRDHKVRHMGLGSARDLPLASAREKAREQRERIARDIDPLERKHADREALRQAEAKRVTFRQACLRYHEAHQSSWTNAAYANEVLSSLERYAFPLLANMDIAAVDRDSILRVLEQPVEGTTFWLKRPQTADRTRNRIEWVIDFSTVRGWRAGDNPARWKNYLDQVLPAPRKLSPVKHLAALPYDQMPGLMTRLAADPTVAAVAARFTILCACRLSESTKAVWSEVGDLDAPEPIFVVPKERMKGRREFRIPLSPQAVALIKSLPREENNSHIFIGTQPGSYVRGPALTEALRRAGCDQTLHGSARSGFRDWCGDRTGFAREVAEAALAHRVGDKAEQSYRRGDALAKRRKLMESWSKYCTTPPVVEEKKGTVLPMRGQA
jgi:integrase